MQTIFIDESGDLGFGRGSSYFVLAAISLGKQRQLNRTLRAFNRQLLDKGWNPELEIKAGHLWRAKSDNRLPASYAYKQTPEVPMRLLLEAIATLDCEIDYVVGDLRQPAPGSHTVRSATLYNYWVWQLLKERLCQFDEVELVLDRRTIEKKSCIKLEGYIECSVGIERAVRSKSPLTLVVHHYHADSGTNVAARAKYGLYGIQAVDMVCWPINRSYETGHLSWLEPINHRIKLRRILSLPLGFNPASSLSPEECPVSWEEESTSTTLMAPIQKVCRTLLRQWRRHVG